MTQVCTDCAAEFDHCHGTLIIHATGPADCTQPGCADLDGVRHDLLIDCRSIAGGCRCVEARQLVAA